MNVKTDQNKPQYTTGAMVKRLGREYLLPYKNQLLMALLFMLLDATMTAVFAKLIQPVLDDVLMQKKVALIIPMAAAVFACFLVRGFSDYTHTVKMNMIGHSIVADVQRDLFKRLVALDLAFFHANPSGELVARVINDVYVLRAAVSDTLTGIGKNFLTLLFLVTLMFMQDWTLSLIAFCAFPPAALFVGIVGKRLRKVSGRVQDRVAGLSDTLSQIFRGIRQVKAYGMEAAECEQSGKVIGDVRNLVIKSAKIGTLSTPFNETLVGLAVMGVIIYGGYQVADDHLTPGALMSFIAAFALAYEPLKRLAKLNNTLQTGLGAGERIFEMMDRRPVIADAPEAATMAARHANITFDGVTFGYAEGEDKALDGISFTMYSGTVTALVGPSGGGKSTILNLIPRFYDVERGRITINGTDIRAVSLESLRKHIALVSQDITIFDDTIRANIAYGKIDAADEEIMAAAEAAAVDRFVHDMPEGYNTRLGENGVRLSGGQRQRIAIARAMLRNAPILLLDEATSALDNESEQAIQDSLRRLQQGRTTLVIAHRLTTVQNADKIIVLDRGKIAEQGTHADLMATQGLYARMVQAGLKE